MHAIFLRFFVKEEQLQNSMGKIKLVRVFIIYEGRIYLLTSE